MLLVVSVVIKVVSEKKQHRTSVNEDIRKLVFKEEKVSNISIFREDGIKLKKKNNKVLFFFSISEEIIRFLFLKLNSK